MGLDKVVEEVLSSGKRRRNDILAEGEEDYQNVVQEAKDGIEEHRRKAGEENKVRIERMRNQNLQTAELKVRRLELAMRRDLLEKVHEGARDKLRQLDRSRNEAMLKTLLSGKDMPGERVFSAAKDEALVRSLTRLPYGGHIDCLGGVVIESSDGSIREDLTYDALLRERSEELLSIIAGILFGEEG